MQPVLELRNVVKDFPGHRAVDNISFELTRGGFYSLLGPSGCGKTTTLRMIGGFEQPTGAAVDRHEFAAWIRGVDGTRRYFFARAALAQQQYRRAGPSAPPDRPGCRVPDPPRRRPPAASPCSANHRRTPAPCASRRRSEEHTSELQSLRH